MFDSLRALFFLERRRHNFKCRKCPFCNGSKSGIGGVAKVTSARKYTNFWVFKKIAPCAQPKRKSRPFPSCETFESGYASPSSVMFIAVSTMLLFIFAALVYLGVFKSPPVTPYTDTPVKTEENQRNTPVSWQEIAAGQKLYEEGKAQESLAVFEKILSREPGNITAKLWKNNCLKAIEKNSGEEIPLRP